MSKIEREGCMGAFGSLMDVISRGMITGSHPPRLNRTEVGNVTISTVDSWDCGPETAVIDATGEVYVLERYETEDEAMEGHDRWVEAISSPTFDGSIRSLGYMNCIEDEDTIIEL